MVRGGSVTGAVFGTVVPRRKKDTARGFDNAKPFPAALEVSIQSPTTASFDVWADCVSVPVGMICCITLNLTCDGVNVPVVLCAEACDCSTVGIEQSPWGTIKNLYE